MVADEMGKTKGKQILPGMVAGSNCLAATWEKCPVGTNDIGVSSKDWDLDRVVPFPG